MTKTEQARIASRWIPKDAEPLLDPNGLGTVYLYGPERKCAVAYKGTGARPSWNFSFRSREKTEQHARDWFTNLNAHAQLKVQWAAERSKPHTLQLGEVVYNSWGYDQTNIDFYQVVRISAHFVWLRPLRQETQETSFMAGPTKPLLGAFASEEITKHHATCGQHGNSICFEHGAGSKWDGAPKYCSWYA